jgi:hypothetical protein
MASQDSDIAVGAVRCTCSSDPNLTDTKNSMEYPHLESTYVQVKRICIKIPVPNHGQVISRLMVRVQHRGGTTSTPCLSLES